MKLSLSGRLVESAEGPIVPVREFLELAARCGYDAVDLRASQLGPETPEAELGEIRAALAGNLCRCTGYVQIIASIKRAAALLREEGAK